MGKHDNCPGWTKTDDTGAVSEYPIESIYSYIYSFSLLLPTNWMNAALWITNAPSLSSFYIYIYIPLVGGVRFSGIDPVGQLNQPKELHKEKETLNNTAHHQIEKNKNKKESENEWATSFDLGLSFYPSRDLSCVTPTKPHRPRVHPPRTL